MTGKLTEFAIEEFAIKPMGSEVRVVLVPDTQGRTYNRADVAE